MDKRKNMTKYLCTEGTYPSGTYFIAEASSEEQLQSKFDVGESLCCVIREAFDDEWYEDEDGSLNYKGDGRFHNNGNEIYYKG